MCVVWLYLVQVRCPSPISLGWIIIEGGEGAEKGIRADTGDGSRSAQQQQQLAATAPRSDVARYGAVA